MDVCPQPAGHGEPPARDAGLELPRGLLHAALTTSAALYYVASGRRGAWVLLAVGALFTAGDVARVRVPRWRAALPAALLAQVRPHERDRVSAITHFVAAATLVAFIDLTVGLPRLAALFATLYLGFGDPSARVAGRLLGWGPVPFLHKTLIGSAAFFLAGTAATLVASRVAGVSLPASALLVGGLGVTVVELLSGAYDNFFVPLLGTLLFWALMAAPL